MVSSFQSNKHQDESQIETHIKEKLNEKYLELELIEIINLKMDENGNDGDEIIINYNEFKMFDKLLGMHVYETWKILMKMYYKEMQKLNRYK